MRRSVVAAGRRRSLGQLSPLSTATSVTGAITSLGNLAIAISKLFQGCGQTCVFTTAIANQVQALLLQNLNTYLAQPVHTASLQAAALATFQQCWAQLVAQCETPANQAAGVNCVADREQGACKWQTATAGAWVNGAWVPPGPQVSSGGVCWNWWVGFHDPIANDPTVVPDPAGSSLVSGSSGTVGTSTDFTPLLLIVAVVLGVLML